MSIIEIIIETLRPYWIPVLLAGMAFLGCVWWRLAKANERN